MLHFNFSEQISLHLYDIIAFGWFMVVWLAYDNVAHKVCRNRSNLMSIIRDYRREWVRQIMRRENRIADITHIANLQRSISFLASTSLFISLGLVTMLGYKQQSLDIIATIPYAIQTSEFMWQAKLFTLILVFIYTFFKFTWSLRQYNYIGIYVSAAPMPGEQQDKIDMVIEKGAELMTNAGRHFNLSMRGYYYGVAVFSWFFHPLAFITATTVVVLVLYRREFYSNIYNILSEAMPVMLDENQK